MKEDNSVELCVISAVLSIVTFVVAHIVFGIEYILEYYISVIATYAMCLAMYVVVLVGPISPTEEKVMQQPLLLFLFVLILWPLAVHIFCRKYLDMVKTKCFEKRLIKENILQDCFLTIAINIKTIHCFFHF